MKEVNAGSVGDAGVYGETTVGAGVGIVGDVGEEVPLGDTVSVAFE